MNSVFSEQILADKLAKLNSSQQCIETLSHWCIFHQSKAELVIAIWDKQFHISEMGQKVRLLYLANDILQNSKRKGNEFVSEFWKVLPAALKDVMEKGDDRGKNVVSRLVSIWEERRVFGSRARSLSDLMLGEDLPPPLEFSKKRARTVKIIKRDSRSIKTKLSIGGTAEKIVSAYHLVLSEHSIENEEMNKCKSAIRRLRKMEADVDLACSRAKDPKRKTLSKELEEEENILRQGIEKLKVVEANRIALVSQLQEALHEQESELENVRTQMQVAHAQAEETSNTRNLLEDENYVGSSKQSTSISPSVDENAKGAQVPKSKKTSSAIAAEVADRLAASSSSQYIMSSVLSTFAAEEAKNAGLTQSSSAPTSFLSLPLNSVNNMPPSQTATSMTQYHLLPNTSSQQYMLPNTSSYAYGPHPPLPVPNMFSPQLQMTQQQMQMTQQQLQLTQQPLALARPHSMPLPQQPPAPPNFRPLGFVQPPGMVFYGHINHSQ
ncbi:hypothetical protein U1Q18_011232 [Sarracenia purpurea var. burkii]